MKQYLITYWLRANPYRMSGIGPGAGAWHVLVKAKDMKEALRVKALPADCDCYKMEIVPVNTTSGGE
jgi:hypothetical protein